MSIYFESTDFEGKDSLPEEWDEGSFKYCSFSKLQIEGGGFGGLLVGCVVKESDWYWGLFNTAVFVNVEFRGCVFRGASFAGCSFTECRFIDCSFIKDNLGGDCSFSESRWYACTQSGCTGLIESVPQAKQHHSLRA